MLYIVCTFNLIPVCPKLNLKFISTFCLLVDRNDQHFLQQTPVKHVFFTSPPLFRMINTEFRKVQRDSWIHSACLSLSLFGVGCQCHESVLAITDHLLPHKEDNADIRCHMKQIHHHSFKISSHSFKPREGSNVIHRGDAQTHRVKSIHCQHVMSLAKQEILTHSKILMSKARTFS